MFMNIVINVETDRSPEEVMDVINWHLNISNLTDVDVDPSAFKFLSAVDVTTPDTFAGM